MYFSYYPLKFSPTYYHKLHRKEEGKEKTHDTFDRVFFSLLQRFNALQPAVIKDGLADRLPCRRCCQPNIFFNVMAKPSAHCCGVPPAISTIAAAAIAAAEPTSAWQPPAAPEIDALFATMKPNAPEVNK